MIRSLHRLASIAGDIKALSRGPDALVKRKVRSGAHRWLAKLLRKSPVKP